MNGKGSVRRPTDEKKYAEGWERIFGAKKQSNKLEEHRCLDCAYDEDLRK